VQGGFPSLSNLRPTLSLLGFPRTLVPTLIEPFAKMSAFPVETVWHAIMDKPSPVAPYLLAPLLFLGPMYTEWGLDKPTVQSMGKALASWQGVRNWVIVSLSLELR
jgi:hypothetical protein